MKYSPWDQLPSCEPQHCEFAEGYFYEHTAKHLIKDAVRIMDNGLAIDINKVIALEEDLKSKLKDVEDRIANNPLIKNYLEVMYASQIEKYNADRKSKMRDYKFYLKDFNYKDMAHRSYFMEIYAKRREWDLPTEVLPSGVSKWSLNLVKKVSDRNPLIKRLLSGSLPISHPIAVQAMNQLAKDKVEIYNKKYVEQINEARKLVGYPVFNPSSSKQKQELFAMLEIESEDVSKQTGLPKWDRAQIERVNKSTNDENVRDFTQAFIDHSFAAIIKNNFIEAFYKYTVNGRLYGQYKLLGAKSGRFTSSNPNMLNTPSTNSIFAKPVKECFAAPKGKIILTADYSALEDRVIASLSKDVNKCNIFLENLDGHSLNALGYFPEEIKEVINVTGNTSKDAIAFKKEVDSKNKVAEAIRQKSKGPTFGLAYGAFPPKIAATLKIPLVEAETIFNNYHNKLYPGITTYREKYVLPTAQEEGQIHLGLGFYLKTDNANRDIRTLANATCQFWSILTALTINKMHQLIDEKGYQDDVKVTSTIYDSIYFEVTEDYEIIKWVNDNLINCMIKDFMEDQAIKNECDSEIGYDWANLKAIPNGADVSKIEEVLNSFEKSA